MTNWWTRRQQAKRDAVMQAARDEVREELLAKNRELQTLTASLYESRTHLTATIAERDRFRSQVREQTEADLVVVSLRIIATAVAGERDMALEQRQTFLQRQLQGMTNTPYGSRYTGDYAKSGMLGGITSSLLQDLLGG